MAKETIKWTEAKLRLAFHLKETQENSLSLADWLDTGNAQFSAEDEAYFGKRRSSLRKNAKFWNEEELKMFFLSFILDAAGYVESEVFRTFLDRDLSDKVENIALHVKPDCLLASGEGDEIQEPYFCFHEYKRSKRNADDPIAQVLLAMMIAQVKNKKPRTIYGCYIVGELWYFMTIDSKEYSIASAIDASTKPGFAQVILVLRKLKMMLEKEFSK